MGPGVASMTTDYRNGVDVMTTETTCLSSIWKTDSDTRAYLAKHHREEDYKELAPADVAYYDGCVYVDLSTVKPMIALPFHPSNTYEIDELASGYTLRNYAENWWPTWTIYWAWWKQRLPRYRAERHPLP